jgi:aryl-alcohol dehydrogenase-like predicted oxidoreductase
MDVCLAAYNYNLLFRDAARDVMPLVRQKGVAFVNAGIMGPVRDATGVRSQPGFTEVRPRWLDEPPGWVTPEVHGRLAKLYDLQRESGLSLVEMAVRYPLANPDIAVVLVGAGSPAEIEETVAAAAEGPLPADVNQAIEELGLK